MVVGNNVWFSNPSTTVWNLTAESGVGSLRIGGNGYDRSIPSNAELLNWINRTQAMGAETILQVPQGGPEADYTLQTAINIAVGLVTYFNIEDHGNKPVKYWSIGNEPWLYYDQKYGPDAIAPIVEAYFKPIAAAMKEVDPTIKIFGPDFAYYIEPALNSLFGGANDISGLVPGKDYYYADGLSWHSYPQDETIKLSTTGVESFRQNMVKSAALVDKVNALHNRTGDDALQWALGEFNAKNGPLVHTWDNGQMFAGIYNFCMKYSATYCTTWSMFENGGNRQGTDYSFIDGNMTPRPTYRHMQMIAQNFWGEYADGTSTDDDLMVFGSTHGDSVSLMIVNRSDKPKSYTLSLSNSPASSDGLQLTIDADTSIVYSDIISGSATQTLVFGNDKILKIRYTIDHFTNQQAPTQSYVEQSGELPSMPLNFTTTAITYRNIDLSWNAGSPTEVLSGFLIERKKGSNGTYEFIGLVDASITTYSDTDVDSETEYYYRIQSYNSAGKSSYSTEVSATTLETPPQVAFNGPHTIPGRIQAEDFDDNEQGIAFNDIDAINEGGATYRNTGVDIEESTEGGYNIGFIEDGEWLEYTIDTITPGNYDLNIRIASNTTGTKGITVLINGRTRARFTPINTGGWQNWTTLTEDNVSITNDNGSVLRLAFTGNEFNINWIEFVEHVETNTDQEEHVPDQFQLFNNYPNPFNPSTNISYSLPTQTKVTLDVFNMIGTKVATIIESETKAAGTYTVTFNAENLSSGTYFYRLKTNEIELTNKMILIK